MLPVIQRLKVLRSLPSLGHQQFHHKRPLTASSLNHIEKISNSWDTFGCLAKKYEQTDRDRNAVTASAESSLSSKDSSDSYQGSLKPSRTVSKFSQEGILDKWHQFKGAQDQEDLKTLASWDDSQEDDAEEDYHFFVSQSSSKYQGQEISPNKISEREKSHQSLSESSGNTFNGTGPPRETSEREVFGCLNPRIEIPDGDEGDLREERYQEAKLERKHRPQFYGMKMKQLCQERKLAEAIKVLEEEMPAVGAKPNNFCYQVLINACGRAGYTKKAFQLFNKMKECRLKVEPVAYTGLFNACAHSPWPTTDGLQRATRLRTQLKEKGYQFNQIVSHAMIKVFGRCGDISTAFLVVDEMIQDGVLVTTETMNFLLQACITDKEAGFRHAIKVWRKMREIKLQPDIYSYNLLMCIIKDCGAGDPSLTSSLLEEGDLHKSSIKSSSKKQLSNLEVLDVKEALPVSQHHPVDAQEETVIVNSEYITGVQRVENSASKCELPDLLGRKITAGDVVALGALDKPQDRLALLGGPTGILQQMVKDRVTPNLKTFTQLLDSLPGDTQAEQCFLESMKNLGLEPDTQFFNMLIKRRNFRGNSKAAQEVLTVMQDYHLIPDLITYGCLALGCNDIFSANLLLKDMDATQFRPNIEIMTSLVKNSLMKQDYAFTVAMMREMQQRGITPNDFLLNLLEQTRARARNSLLFKHESSERNQEKRKRSAVMFLAAYKVWLTESRVQLPEHPWAQYR